MKMRIYDILLVFAFFNIKFMNVITNVSFCYNVLAIMSLLSCPCVILCSCQHTNSYIRNTNNQLSDTHAI